MEDKRKKFPSIPSNYVTLQQLQERRLKEQELRQKEKEREEKEHRREVDEDRRLREEEMERRRRDEIERKQAIEGKASGWSNPRKPRNFSGMERGTEKKIGSDMQKGGCVDIGIAADGRIADEEDQKPEESRQKKKKNRKKQQKKTMKWKCEAEPQSGVLEQSPAAENGGQRENEIPVESKEEENKPSPSVGRKNKTMEAEKQKEEEDLGGIRGKEEYDREKKERITVERDGKNNPVRKQRKSRGTANEKKAAAARDSAHSGVRMELMNVTVTVEEIAVADHHGQEEEKEKLKQHGELTTLRAESEKHYYGGRGCSGGRGRCRSYGRGGNTGVSGQMWIKKGENSESPMASSGSDSKS